MKIGILSMQKVPNYGSFLQALALKKQLERLSGGGDVYFIDIEEGTHPVPPAQSGSTPAKLMGKLDKYALKRIENYLFTKRMDKIHAQDHITYLETEKKLADGDLFDLAVIGSDEVFNAGTPSRWGFTTQLFGEVKRAKQVVTYAASCGQTTKAVTDQYGMTDAIARAMRHLRSISVRDKGTYDLVYGITGRKAEMHVDPVFLADFDAYIPKLPKRKPYLLVYAYVNRIQDENEIYHIQKFARDNGLEILSVGTQQRWCKHNIAANAFELLAYVKGASFIVTDTFHGAVFSIKYNKPFAAFIRESNQNKLGELLSHFGLADRSLTSCEELGVVLRKKIEFERINAIINEEKKRSEAYLDRVIKEAIEATKI